MIINTFLTAFLILILLAVVLHCCIAILISYSRQRKSEIIGIVQQKPRQIIDNILKAVLTFFTFFVGNNWRSWGNLTRLALCYYIILPNLMFFRTAESLYSENWQYQAPFMNLILMNLWVIINFTGDYISYNISRDLINSYLNSSIRNVKLTLKIVFIDFAVASLLLAFVIFSTNFFHYFYSPPNSSFSLNSLLKYAFDINNHSAIFSLFIDKQKIFSFPGLAIVSFSTFFPTVFWAVTLVLSIFAMPLKTWQESIATEIEKDPEVRNKLFSYRMKYFTFLASSIGGLIVILKLNTG